MHFKIHSIFISIFLFFVFTSNAQNGLNFQGVARNTNNIILASQPISLRLSIIRTSVNGTTDYTEVRKVTTNAQGLFSVVIGDTGAISALGNFATIDWKLGPKFLKIEMDVTAGNNFVLIGTTQFQSVAYAQFAQSVDAEKLNGIVPVEKGGTGTTSLVAFKTALSIDKNTVGLSNVNNTADTAKPISNATKLELDTKVSTETFSNTVNQLAPIASPTFTGTVRGINKTMVGLGNIDNTADTAKPISNATKLELDTKVSTETFSSTVLTKENAANKSTATNLGAAAASDILFPTQKAVKTYVDAQSNAGGVADGGITTIKLADAAVTDAKIGTGINKAKVGLENVDNTADADKPISTATQVALDNKLDLNIAETAYARVDQSNLFLRDQAIEGGLTANRINFPGNYNSFIDVFPIPLTDLESLNLNNDFFVSVGKTLVDETKGWIFDVRNNNFILPNGTQIQSGANSSTIIQTRADTDFSIKTSAVEFEGIEFGELDPREHELKFTADGKLRFSDGSRIYSYLSDQEEELKNVFSIRSKTEGYIELKTTSEDDDYYWTFKDDGKITFPDRITTMGVSNSTGSPIFELNSPNGLALFGGYLLDENSRFGGIGIYPNRENPDSEDKFEIDLVISSSESYNPNVWKYDSQGSLTFPDGTIISGNISSTAYPVSGFGLEGIVDKPLIFQTKNNNNEVFQWMFGSNGEILFPDNYVSLGNTPGGFGFYIAERNFEINVASEIGSGLLSFKPNGTLSLSFADNNGDQLVPITNVSMGVISNTSFNIEYPGQISFTNEAGKLSFEENGVLAIPGTISLSNTTSETSINISPNTEGWSYLQLPNNANSTTANVRLHNDGGNIELATGNFGDNVSPVSSNWIFSKNGSLTFPDLTIASGNISNTANFGFDTSPTNSGFSIITSGTSSGTTELWSFDTNGILNLPGSASIGMVYTTPFFFQEELQITTPNGLLLKSSKTNDKYWRFEENGNTVFPADLGIEGDLSNVRNIIASNDITTNGIFKIGNENILDKYKQQSIILDNSQRNLYNLNNTYQFTLSATPRSKDHVAMYINGIRVKPNFTVSGNTLIYTKSKTETEVEVQFDYIIN